MKLYIYGLFLAGMITSCSVTRPYAVTNNSIGSKTGSSTTTVVFGTSAGTTLAAGLFVTNKDFGVIEAAKNGKIEKIGAVDVKTTNFIFFQKVEIIVSGE
jgi:hypothetical protein